MNILFFTGAGVSEESGIPTFRRGTNSLWDKYNVDIVASTRGLNTHLDKVLEFHNEARNLIEKCEPNYCHQQIAKLEENHRVGIITTNIDNLHERAGSTSVIHLHGSIFEICDIYKQQPYMSNIDIKVGDVHPQTKEQLRYNTVLFGEQLDEDISRLHNDIVSRVDLLVIIGSSLSVWPSNKIVNYNDNIIYLNPTLPINVNYNNWKIIQKTACNGIDDILNLINK